MVIFDNFEDRTLDYKKWMSKAIELEQSAEVLAETELRRVKELVANESGILEDYVSMMPQIIMLYAFSIENYLKALLALRKKININDGRIRGLNHDLVEIIRIIGINIGDDMENTIKKYTRHIIWEGRYPAPIRKSDLPEFYDSSNIYEWPNTYVHHNDIEISRNLLIQIKFIIDHQIKHIAAIKND